MNRRTFLRNGIWLLSAPTVIIPRLSVAQVGLVGAKLSGFSSGVTSAGGTVNNVALVGSNKCGGTALSPVTSIAFAMPSSVVNGNNVIFTVATAAAGAITFTAAQLTKTAGTSTIGTIVLDQQSNAGAGALGTAIYRVPITGSGSLTLTWNPAAAVNVLVSAAEFTGMAASPFDSGGSGNNTGTSSGSGLAQGETSGSITSATVGAIVYIATEISNINWTRLLSDTVIFNGSSGASNMTGVGQFKIIGSSPNTLQSSVEATGITWKCSFASYKSS